MPDLFQFSAILQDFPRILAYLPVTLEISLISIAFSWLLGFAVALVKINRIPVLRAVTAFYVSYMRGTPILVQLYLSYYGVPIIFQYVNYYWGTHISINYFPKMIFVIIAFSLNEGAYASETIRAALLSVDKGQTEAGLSIGMSKRQTFLSVVLPEALIVAVPSLGNQFIGLIKSTSLAFVCSVVEMTAEGQLVASSNFRFFEMYIALSLIYWAISILLSRGLILLEKKLKKSDREVKDNAEDYRAEEEVWQ